MLDDVEPAGPEGLLQGKVILVTGASQGIGLVSAFAFAKAGASVVLAARRGSVVAEHAATITDAGGVALGIGTDVTDEDSVRALVDRTVERFGRLDGAFNNAGIDQLPPAPLHEVSLAEWRSVHAVKVDGTFLCLKYEALAMMGSGGSIVNNGSVVSEHTLPPYPAPASSQSALLGLTRSAAVAYGPHGIRVNLVKTGAILTPERAEAARAHALEGAVYSDELTKSLCPLGRFGRPVEVAQVAGWLLSDWSTYVTGAFIAIDGGYLAGHS